ncbi:MAG: NAD(P)H-hydrate dehydratase [Planctomycetota bacterium]
MTNDLIVTREIAPLPSRRDDAHKGEVGRIVIIGGTCGPDAAMVGAPALAANGALRAGAGLVQLLVPAEIRTSTAVLAPCATTRTLPSDSASILAAIADFSADVVAIGPGLGSTLAGTAIVEVLTQFSGPAVVDADALNRLAEAPTFALPRAHRIVMTPHPGEARRLLSARGRPCPVDETAPARRQAACDLVAAYGCTVVLKGRHTVVTNGDRLFVNETGNSGMATGGTGDVLTGVIAGLIGQKMDPLEASILGVYLHGLAGDYAAEELGRWSMTAIDLLDYLPEAFSEHEATQAE